MSETAPISAPKIVPASDTAEAVRQVVAAVRAGECVVFPTDTVYGIGADAFSPAAVQRLLDAKRRGRDMPPPVLIGEPSVMDALARDIPDAARELAERHWPGALTLILWIRAGLRMDLGESNGSIALRLPDSEVARELLRETGPLAVSSANRSGEEPATDVHEAARQLGHSVAVYVDGGPTPGSIPSTIVDFTTGGRPRAVRVGMILLDTLRETVPGLLGPDEPDHSLTDYQSVSETPGD